MDIPTKPSDRAISRSPSNMKRCKECGNKVTFAAEVFGTICPSCGALQEDESILVSNVASTTTDQKKNTGLPNGRKSIIQTRIDQHRKDLFNADQDGFRKSINRQDKQRLIKGILSKFDCLSLKREVEQILLQAHAIVSGSDESVATLPKGLKDVLNPKDLDASICAACFLVIRKHSSNITLTSICELVEQNLVKVTKSLNNTERILSLTKSANDLSGKSRQTAAFYLDAQIKFLIHQQSLPIKHDLSQSSTHSENSSLLTKADKIYLSRSDIGSPSFHSTATLLTKLCSDRGLNNRVGKRGVLLDLGISAWAILMLTIEAQTGETCAEKRFAQLATWAPGWRVGKKLGGYTKVQLGFASSDEGKGSDAASVLSDDESIQDDYSIELDNMTIQQARRTAINSVSTLVHYKYHDICRLLSVYIRHLPWLEQQETVGGKRSRGKARRQKVDTTLDVDGSIDDILPRSTIVRHINEVLKLRDMLEEKVDQSLRRRQPDDETSVHTPWSKMWNQKPQIVAVPELDDEDAPSHAQFIQYDNLYDALFALPIGSMQKQHPKADQRSDLAKSIGPPLLTLNAIQEMDTMVVDRLLFRDAELDDYICSEDEIKLKKLALNHSANGKSGGESPKGLGGNDEVALVSRSRTKARDLSEIERILSSL